MGIWENLFDRCSTSSMQMPVFFGIAFCGHFPAHWSDSFYLDLPKYFSN